VPLLDGEQTLDEAIAQLKRDTHRYVRHQETWLRRNARLQPIDVSQPDWIQQAIVQAANFLKEEGPHWGSPPPDPRSR
jgi:tRNA A37 N6-isopentenylltransferase MiaA